MKYTEWNDAAKEHMAGLRLIFQTSKGNGVTQDQRMEMLHLHDLEHRDDLRRFGNALDWLTRLLYEHDPIDLVPCVVPKDEYDIEARMILRELAIRGTPGLKEITEVVHQIFVMEFDNPSAGTIDRPCYEAIAKELFDHTKDWQGK
jgi:hypothetical protein